MKIYMNNLKWSFECVLECACMCVCVCVPCTNSIIKKGNKPREEKQIIEKGFVNGLCHKKPIHNFHNLAVKVFGR